MIVGVPREIFPGERRVALVPGVVPALAKAGLEVVVEAGAGVEAGYHDADYESKGAKVLASRGDVFSRADIIVQVLCYGSNDRTGRADLPLFKRGQALIGFLRPLGDVRPLEEIAAAGVTSFSVELMPRITRAQNMDALSSMGTICGYKAVLIAADKLPRTLPDADHRRRDHHARARSGHRRGCCGPASHRNRSPVGSGGLCVRSAARW